MWVARVWIKGLGFMGSYIGTLGPNNMLFRYVGP